MGQIHPSTTQLELAFFSTPHFTLLTSKSATQSLPSKSNGLQLRNFLMFEPTLRGACDTTHTHLM